MKHKLQTLFKHNWRTLLLLLTLITASHIVMADDGCFYTDGAWMMYFVKDGSSYGTDWTNKNTNINLGNVTTLTLKGCGVKTWWNNTYRMDVYVNMCNAKTVNYGFSSRNTGGNYTWENNNLWGDDIISHCGKIDGNSYSIWITYKLLSGDNVVCELTREVSFTYKAPTPAVTFAEGDVVWLDIRHDGNSGWGVAEVSENEWMYVNLNPANNSTTREMTKVAQNNSEKNSLWVYRFTSTDEDLNKSTIKFQRGSRSNGGRWDMSIEFSASDLSTYNGIYINNDDWSNVGTKFNFTTSNNVVSTPTLTMKDNAGSSTISSCTSGETVKFYESTQTITTTISGTAKARTLSNPLYTYTFSEGPYSSGQTTANPHSWTTGDTYLGSGTAKVKITFAIDGNSTPTPASSINSGYAKESSGTSFTVNPSCTAPNTSNFTVTSGTNKYVYNGSAHSATVTGVSPYTPSNIVAYYGINSSTTATSQTDAGTYDIYVHSADAYGDYCAVTSTIPTALATKLVISPVTPSSSNYSDLFSITGTGSHAYTGVAQSVAVAWKSPYTGCTGDITVKYNGSTTAPTNVGSYPITISVEDGTNNNASEDDISVGTLTITAISPGLTLNNISNKCGTGDYALSSTSNSAGAVTYSVTSGNAEIVNETTLRVNATGDVTVKASQVADGNYTEQEVSKIYTFSAGPVAGFSASAVSSTLEFSNTPYVSTTLNTDANSEWDFQWICDSHPTWGTNNTPTIVSSTSNSTEVQFPIEGVYTFHVGAKCKKDESYISSSTVTVTVSLPLCIKGPLTNSDGENWSTPVLISNISNNNTRTYKFTAYCKQDATYERQFVLNASSNTSDDSHHIHNDYNYLTLENIEDSGHNNNLRATTALGITNAGTPVVLTITHNGGLYYNLSLALDCSTPEAKTISISASSVCEGESANVIVASSQSGYIYTVYDSNSSVAGSGTGDGSNLNISVAPSSNTTYKVKAKQGSTCSETAMSNTVDVAVSPRPKYSPASGITQYLPVTVTSTADTPAWSIVSKDPNVDAAWISNTSGASTVFKAPTGSYTVSDGTCATGSITVSDDTETCD